MSLLVRAKLLDEESRVHSEKQAGEQRATLVERPSLRMSPKALERMLDEVNAGSVQPFLQSPIQPPWRQAVTTRMVRSPEVASSDLIDPRARESRWNLAQPSARESRPS